MSNGGRHPGFRESQELVGRGTAMLLVFLMAFALALGAYALATGPLSGDDRVATVVVMVVGSVLVGVLARLRLDVELDDERLRIDMPPVAHRVVPLPAIRDVRLAARRWYDRKAGYSILPSRRDFRMRAAVALEINLSDGMRIVLDTRRPGELLTALQDRLPTASPKGSRP